MIKTRTRVAVAVVATMALFGVPGAVWADCVDGVRDPTPAELGFAARAEAALATALPAPVANSERRGAPYDFSRQPRLSFCRSAGEGAFSSSASGGYLYKFPKAEADRMYAERKSLEKQIEELEKLPPEKEGQHKQLLAQMRTAYDAAPFSQRPSVHVGATGASRSRQCRRPKVGGGCQQVCRRSQGQRETAERSPARTGQAA